MACRIRPDFQVICPYLAGLLPPLEVVFTQDQMQGSHPEWNWLDMQRRGPVLPSESILAVWICMRLQKKADDLKIVLFGGDDDGSESIFVLTVWITEKRFLNTNFTLLLISLIMHL